MPLLSDLYHLAGPTIAAIWCIGTVCAASASGLWWLLWGRRIDNPPAIPRSDRLKEWDS